MGFLFFAWIPPLLFPLPPRRFIPASHHNSSQLHFSHLTYHISHHISLITPQLITAPLLTHHLSHLSSHLTHHTTTHHSSTSHTSLITSLITSSSSHHNFSHLTYHISHHIFIITPQNMTAPLLTSHSSHQCGREQRPRGDAACVAAAGPRLSFVWQAHYAEPFGGAAARVAAAGPRLAVVWQPLRATMACTFSTYFLDIATSKSASNMRFVPQRHVLFRHLNCQK